MKEPKFKVGDCVICLSNKYGCDTIVGKKCTIVKVMPEYTTPQYLANCDGINWFVEEGQLEPTIDTSVLQDCLTDPNIDYEKVTENPIYFEFVDIGKALNKLKDYEHKYVVNTTYSTPIDMDFHKGDTVFFISELKIISCGLVHSVNTGSVCIEFPMKGISVYPIHKCFKTYQEAINALEKII